MMGRYLRVDPSHKQQPIPGESVLHFFPYIIYSPNELNSYNYAQNKPLKRYDPTGLISEECCYEWDWQRRCCLQKGPKKLDLNCFSGCLARNSSELLIGIGVGVGMIVIGHPVLGGVMFIAVAADVYVRCYVPCKSCPGAKVINFR